MFTNDEAMRKRCPYGGTCLGAACMAWRWAKERGTGPIRVIAAPPTASPDLPESETTSWHSGDRNEDGTINWGEFPRTGYCGLAGRP